MTLIRFIFYSGSVVLFVAAAIVQWDLRPLVLIPLYWIGGAICFGIGKRL